MSDIYYPVSVAEIPTWSRAHRLRMSDGRERFAQYVTLQAMSQALTQLPTVAFKGGNALNFGWMPNRSTFDLDFSVTETIDPHTSHVDMLREAMASALTETARHHDMTMRVQTVVRNPTRLSATFPTYAVRIAYAYADDDQASVRRQILAKQPANQVVRVEVTVNDIVCEYQPLTLPSGHTLPICTLDDIVAEKLRALLQQTIRNRYRPQDVLDIAMCVLTRSVHLHDVHVATFLLRKAAARDVPVSQAAFAETDIWERAATGYADLAARSAHFIPFDEARAIVQGFVRELDLPPT